MVKLGGFIYKEDLPAPFEQDGKLFNNYNFLYEFKG